MTLSFFSFFCYSPQYYDTLESSCYFFVCARGFMLNYLFFLKLIFYEVFYFLSPFLFTLSQPSRCEPLLFLINNQSLPLPLWTLKQYSPAAVTGHVVSYAIYGGKTRRHPLEILLSFFLYVCCSRHCFHLSEILTCCLSCRTMLVSLYCIAVYLLFLWIFSSSKLW